MKRFQTLRFSQTLWLTALMLWAMRTLATVTFSTRGAYLKTPDGMRMPTNGLVLLVVSATNNTFTTPTANSFVSDDDFIVAKWDLSATSLPGVLLDIAPNLTLSGDWNPGDPLQLYWFPTLDKNAAAPGAAGVPYGQYRTDSTIDGSAPWITPSDSATISLIFRTTDAGGSSPSNSGNASLVVGGVATPAILSLTKASATNVLITWSASSNLTYRVQYQSDLGMTWSNLVPDILATNHTASAIDSFGGPVQRFYRVQLVP